MLNNINCQENTNHIRYRLILFEWFLSKRQEISVGKDVERRELLRTVGGNVNCCSYYWEQYRGSSKKLELAYDPALSLVGTYPNK